MELSTARIAVMKPYAVSRYLCVCICFRVSVFLPVREICIGCNLHVQTTVMKQAVGLTSVCSLV